MAVIALIFGGVFGFAIAALSFLLGASLYFSLMLWSGGGLFVAALLVALARMPSEPAQPQSQQPQNA